MANFDLSQIQISGASGFDSLFDREPQIVKPLKTTRRRVASLQDLKGFQRVSEDTLVRKSDNDLWAIRKESNGSFFIERLFDDVEPVKG